MENNKSELNPILENSWTRGMDYPAYRQMIDELLAKGRTTGPEQTETRLEYTRLNQVRMDKWDKHYQPGPALKEWGQNADFDEYWLVISEAWCGDAAHALPVMSKVSEVLPGVQMRILLRDENLALMDHFLTCGTRSIPILIRLDPEDFSVKGTWGPRPSALEPLFSELRESENDPAERKKQLQLWYARNRGKAIEADLTEAIVTSLAPEV